MIQLPRPSRPRGKRDSRLTWLRQQLRELAGTGSPQQLLTTLTGRDHVWWDCCREAVQGDPGWFLEPETDQIRSWASTSAADGRAGTEASVYLDSTFAVARAVSSAAQHTFVEPDLERVARRWEMTGLLLPDPDPAAGASPGLAGRAMVSISELMLKGPGPRHRSVVMPVVFGVADNDGQIGDGLAGLLELRELPGGPAGPFPDPRALPLSSSGPAFTRSLGHAWAASPRRCKERCVIWRIVLPDETGNVPAVEGGSLGAAFAVGFRELFRYPLLWDRSLGWLLRVFHGLRPKTAITGVVGDDQRLRYVSGMGAKLSAAHLRRWMLIAPAENKLDRAQAPDPAILRFAGSIGQADRIARRWRVGRVLTATLIVIASALAGTLTASHSAADAARQQAALRESSGIGGYVVSQMNSLPFDPALPVSDALLAADAYSTSPTAQATQALFDAYATLSPYQAIIGTFAGSNEVTDLSVDRPGDIAVLSRDGETEVWTITGGLPARHLIGVLPGTSEATVSPDGTEIGVLAQNGTLQLWATRQLRLKRQVRLPDVPSSPPDGGVKPAFDQDDRYLAIAGPTSPLIWNLTSGKLQQMTAPALADQQDQQVGFLGEDAAFGLQQDGAKFFWDPATGKVLASPESTLLPVLDSPSVAVSCLHSAWSFSYLLSGQTDLNLPANIPCTAGDTSVALNGAFLVVVQSLGDGFFPIAEVIDLHTGQETGQASLPNSAHVAGIDPSGRFLFLEGDPSGIARLTLQPDTGPSSLTSPDGRFLAQPSLYPGSSIGARVKILDAKSGRLLHTLVIPPGNYPPNSVSTEYVTQAAFLPGGQLLVLAAGALTLWNAATGKMTSTPVALYPEGRPQDPSQDPPSPVIAVDPAVSGEIALTGPGGTSVEIWRVTGWHRTAVIGPLAGQVSQLSFSQDGTLLVAATENGIAEIINPATGTVLAKPASTVGAPSLEMLKFDYLGIVSDSDIYLSHGGMQGVHVTAMPGTIFEIEPNNAGSATLAIGIQSASGSTTDVPSGVIYLPPNPAAWESTICAVVGRKLSSQELSLPGADTPDNGC